MNGLRCPKCSLVNLLSAEKCHRCGASLEDLPATAQVSVPVEQTFQARAFRKPYDGIYPRDSETGRKTFLWYRVYLGLIAVLNLVLVFAGILLIAGSTAQRGAEAAESLMVGSIYAVMGAVFALVYLIAIFLPRKPYNWIVGIVMIAFGLTSCCFLPITIPLLVFWLKPETKAYFGRT